MMIKEETHICTLGNSLAFFWRNLGEIHKGSLINGDEDLGWDRGNSTAVMVESDELGQTEDSITGYGGISSLCVNLEGQAQWMSRIYIFIDLSPIIYNISYDTIIITFNP